MSSAAVLHQLACARRVADHAHSLGIQREPSESRQVYDHLGAALADAILQAGVNYRTVVHKRVERIQSEFPEAATMSGIISLIARGGTHDFLLWRHPAKVMRFISLARLLASNGVETTGALKRWLDLDGSCEQLLGLHGIGPKTCDYLCCLVGIDRIAVDRHIRTFADEAGVTLEDYQDLKSIMCCAADLLGVARRDFDAWIWRIVSARTVMGGQAIPTDEATSIPHVAIDWD